MVRESADSISSPAELISIVVPTYREAQNLEPLITEIAQAMHAASLRYEVILVDDDSRDGSEDVVARLAAEGHPVRIITRVSERGLSSAVIRGFHESKGTCLVCMDADLSHPPEAVPRLVKALRETEIDFVIGSRYVPGGSTDEDWGMLRRWNSKIATLLARPFTSVKDPMAGLFALPRAVFDRAEALDPIGYKIGLELIVKCRCRKVREIPIHFIGRRLGESKLNLKEQFNYLRHLARLAMYKCG